MEETLHFFNEDIKFKIHNKGELTEWISSVAHGHNHQISCINYIFCSDEFLLSINEEYLNHNYYTDILTFDHSNNAGHIHADIYISIDRVNENARSYNTSPDDELHRVMIHGLLHLMGFQDHSDDLKQIMRQKEDACLSLLKK